MADEHRMVVVNGIRYRRADAERLGLLAAGPNDTADTATDATPKAESKARTTSRNKARRPKTQSTGGDDDRDTGDVGTADAG